jgi:hypothetical protein
VRVARQRQPELPQPRLAPRERLVDLLLHRGLAEERGEVDGAGADTALGGRFGWFRLVSVGAGWFRVRRLFGMVRQASRGVCDWVKLVSLWKMAEDQTVDRPAPSVSSGSAPTLNSSRQRSTNGRSSSKAGRGRGRTLRMCSPESESAASKPGGVEFRSDYQ